MKQLLVVFSSVLLLIGCASDAPAPPAPQPPTIIQLQIESSNMVNLGVNGEASPVILKLYELSEPSSFNAADFFALFNDDKAILGGDLTHKTELVLKPGESKNLLLQPNDDAKSLGLFAAFRLLDNAQWRANATIEQHKTQSMVIKLEQNQLKVELPH